MTQNIFFAEQKPRVRGETLLSRDSRRSNLLRVDWVRFPTIVSSDRAQQEQASTWLLLFGGVEVSWLGANTPTPARDAPRSLLQPIAGFVDEGPNLVAPQIVGKLVHDKNEGPAKDHDLSSSGS
ncbi:hypothetical protein Cob_v000746 [Colletotrichum orbiculare MAFF 240422]|uniref:Uncharacterized protein n=1 Tax=Colletotrichum orbiculare (strain 104-T / ATCC 96160 / CBS 514.97 / LARS 414 / MAFF 240422) TaxID=1213857 RepID=N4VHT6_COLOR|nr:hypothetical protein Cob_v000746 [Colletotrichum orbiculare MAFF 240422]